MKPVGHVYDDVCCLDNLFGAAKATLAQGRRFCGEGAKFKFNLEGNILRLHEQLSSERYRHGRYSLFKVYDPKVRIIAAASVRDRVVHHAIHDVIEPRLDRMFIADSYACRHGKGTYRALERAHGFFADLPNSETARRFILSLVFASAKRPVMIGVLKRIDIKKSAGYVGQEESAVERMASPSPESGHQRLSVFERREKYRTKKSGLPGKARDRASRAP